MKLDFQRGHRQTAINFLPLISLMPGCWTMRCVTSPFFFLPPHLAYFSTCDFALMFFFFKGLKRTSACAPSQPAPLPEWWSIEMINLHNGALNWPITPTSQQPAPMESSPRVAIALEGATCFFHAGVSFHHAGCSIWLVDIVLNNVGSYSWVICCRNESSCWRSTGALGWETVPSCCARKRVTSTAKTFFKIKQFIEITLL